MSIKPHFILSSLLLISCLDFLNKEEPEEEEENDAERSEGETQGDCTDGEDNDNDGYVDCDDQGCWERPACSEITTPDTGSGPDDPLEDNDGDGFSVEDGDCDDSDPDVYPGMDEIPYDGVDNDCDETTLDDDLDRDGFSLEAGDCDDTNGSIHPEAEDSVCDNIDQNCDGIPDDGWDSDQLEPNDSWSGDESASNYYGEYGNVLTGQLPAPMEFESYLFPEGDEDDFALFMVGGSLLSIFDVGHQVSVSNIPVGNTVKILVDYYTGNGLFVETIADETLQAGESSLQFEYEALETGYYNFRVISVSGQSCDTPYSLSIGYKLL